MRRITLRLFIALLAFAVGIAAYALFNRFLGLWNTAKPEIPSLSVSLQSSTPTGLPAETHPSACRCSSDTGMGTGPATNDSTGPLLRTLSGGILNGKAVSLPKPPYPPLARAAKVSGTVVVRILVDERGCVLSADAVSGHPLLRAAAVQAASLACFSPTRLQGEPTRVSGILTYNFLR
jgi:TonB family protein